MLRGAAEAGSELLPPFAGSGDHARCCTAFAYKVLMQEETSGQPIKQCQGARWQRVRWAQTECGIACRQQTASEAQNLVRIHCCAPHCCFRTSWGCETMRELCSPGWQGSGQARHATCNHATCGGVARSDAGLPHPHSSSELWPVNDAQAGIVCRHRGPGRPRLVRAHQSVPSA